MKSRRHRAVDKSKGELITANLTCKCRINKKYFNLMAKEMAKVNYRDMNIWSKLCRKL